MGAQTLLGINVGWLIGVVCDEPAWRMDGGGSRRQHAMAWVLRGWKAQPAGRALAELRSRRGEFV